MADIFKVLGLGVGCKKYIPQYNTAFENKQGWTICLISLFASEFKDFYKQSLHLNSSRTISSDSVVYSITKYYKISQNKVVQ